MPDEITAAWVAEKLEETHEKPFFIVAGMNRPHVPRYAPGEFFDLFPLDSIQLPPYLENDLDDCTRRVMGKCVQQQGSVQLSGGR